MVFLRKCIFLASCRDGILHMAVVAYLRLRSNEPDGFVARTYLIGQLQCKCRRVFVATGPQARCVAFLLCVFSGRGGEPFPRV